MMIEDKELAAAIATIRRRMAAQVADARRDLSVWMETSPHDPCVLQIALLETALTGMIADHGTQDAADLVNRTIQRLSPVQGNA